MPTSTAVPGRTATSHLDYLDGVRGIAITLVLLDHFAGLSTGRLGVDLFFALSGLLIAKVLFDHKVPLGVFYQRRMARIMPNFVLYLGAIAITTEVLRPGVPWQELGYTALFLRTYLPGDHIWDSGIPIGHIWSLAVEEHGYVVLSLVALASARSGEGRARWLLVLLSLASAGAYQFYRHAPPHGSTADLRTECAVLPLIVSAALLLWRRTLPQLDTRAACWGATVVTVAGVWIGLVGELSHGGNVLKFIVVPAALALMVNTVHTAPTLVLRGLSARWLMWLGTRSFSIYLWNYPFFFLAARGHWPFGPVAGLVASLAVSEFCYRFIEQPMRLWVRNLGRSQPSARRTDAAAATGEPSPSQLT